MRVDFANILGEDIPNMLDNVRNLESKLTPQLALIQSNRDKIDPVLLAELDKAMDLIKDAKTKLNAINNNK
jgi:hypothetical protein